ncbi:Hypothetical predicted protein [Mytilus galloprovincialis]|uniref:Tyr recombinase domain-containing protein n=1 Tax=Mytilus galloprovincialis TaxID=29158 RepID=A0A8B6EX46_MYTGA|nr:Hypothetical predicted protein [Mytilus galloprovincialis]
MQGAVGPVVRLRTRSMYECILYKASWNANVLLNSRSLDEIIFWKENIEKMNGRELHIVEQYSSVVYTDASGIGYGGYLVKAIDEEIMGSWNDGEKLKSSTWRELEAVYRVLQSISMSLKGQTVKWHTDNQNVVNIIKKGSKKSDLQNITIKIANNWGPHTVDRFATDYNAKCSIFNTKHWCPGTLGIDAFNRQWGKENNWIVPPPSDISRCIHKIIQDKADSTLFVPLWVSAPYWPLLHKVYGNVVEFESFIKDSKILPSTVIKKGRGRNDPTENAFVTNLLESSKRQPHKPKVKKEHIDSESIIELCIKYKDSDDIAILRDLCMIVLSFSGFLRYNELSSLRCKDVHFKTNYLEIDIDKSKTDQYRLGEKLVISNGESAACPYNLLSKYFSICKIESSSEQYLFKPIFRSDKRCSLIYKNKKLSYTRARECIVARLKEVCGDINIGLHSLRAGGATVAANADVNERCWKRHGRWKSDTAKMGTWQTHLHIV